jgi:hypothetical protein
VWYNGEVVVVKAEEELMKTDAIRRTELMQAIQFLHEKTMILNLQAMTKNSKRF